MKKALSDLKSFVTVFLMLILGVIVIADLFGLTLEHEILLLFTNTITGVITYYFNKKDEVKEVDGNDIKISKE